MNAMNKSSIDTPIIAVLANNHIFQQIKNSFELFKVDILANYDDAINYLRHNTPEAVIVEKQDNLALFFENVCQEIQYPKRPILCCYTNGHKPDISYADISVTDETLSILLPPMIRSRQQALELQCEYDKLQMQLKEAPTKDEVALLKNTIVRNVSHELRTPLLQVKSAVALIAEDIKDEKLNEYATGAVARLENVVKNITMLSESLKFYPSPIFMHEAYIHGRRNLLRVWNHSGEGDRIIDHIAPKLPPVYADKQGLSTVFQLLLDNALKFSEDAVHVSIKLTESGNEIRVSVEDTGIGIEQANLDSIFDSFYQIDGSNTRRFSGTGVGLAIVKHILDNHGTSIHVESELNQGSKFSFTLPVLKLDNS